MVVMICRGGSFRPDLITQPRGGPTILTAIGPIRPCMGRRYWAQIIYRVGPVTLFSVELPDSLINFLEILLTVAITRLMQI